ncbi:MAG TPA: rhodanese-like domain-containing protein [Puia sp.]|nr:rhodanese-like domain-containing protein [Puia sp.]
MKSLRFGMISPLLVLTFGCFGQNDPVLSPADFQKQIDQKNIQVLDVRTPSEFNSGHIKQSMLADWNNQSQFMDRVKYLDKSKPVYVYCLSGGRSSAAARWMRENGYQSVYELQGGIRAWKTASLPLEGTTEVKQLSATDYMAQVGDKGLVLVDFGAEWCPPCRKMQPVVEQLTKEMGSKFRLLAMDGGAQTNLMSALKVDGIPTFILYKNGKEVWRNQGITEIDEFRKQISSH